jgi:hypothetical protein
MTPSPDIVAGAPTLASIGGVAGDGFVAPRLIPCFSGV